MSDKKRILETIYKMSQLTEDAGAFQGEASAAAAKIQELMEKYAISQMEIDTFSADRQEKEFKVVFESVESEFQHKDIREWEWSLVRLISKITMTRCYTRGHGMFKKYGVAARMVFFGVKENAATAAELYALWHDNIEKIADKAQHENIIELRKKYGRRPALRLWIAENHPEDDPRYFRSSWIRGCLNAMHSKVFEEEQARRQPEEDDVEFIEAGSQTIQQKKINTAAIVLYKAEVDKAYAVLSENFKNISTGGGSKGWSGKGYERGHKFGSSVRIGSKQLED